MGIAAKRNLQTAQTPKKQTAFGAQQCLARTYDAALQKELIEDVEPAPESLSSTIDVLDDTPYPSEVMTDMPLVETPPVETAAGKTHEVAQAAPSEAQAEGESGRLEEETADTESV